MITYHSHHLYGKLQLNNTEGLFYVAYSCISSGSIKLSILYIWHLCFLLSQNLKMSIK